MNEVREHVDKMFAKYPKTDETRELKEEVIGNLEAEIEDLQSNGVSFDEAFRISIGKMEKLDELIDGVKTVRISNILTEMMQWTLIYTLIAWILTIPLSVFHSVRSTSWILFIIITILGVIYLILYSIKGILQKYIMNINLFKIDRWKKFIWIIWFLFILIKWGMVTAITFGSNIWFWRPISINGPYEFAGISLMYAVPLITIIIPLLMSRLKKIIDREDKDNSDER
ncbi:permease prefix domain 1-containing protein [Psychrobacillus sp. NPDC096426]|uniref:permease prefix domain 1-containing protein n=1 Tax=Psychrobacillus sp. NPDC096426 TaxID=3364491 RepID=UPI003821D974